MQILRGLSEAQKELIGGEGTSGIRELLGEAVKRPELELEVRHDYLSCYYRGGSLFKMSFRASGDRPVKLEFDTKYFDNAGDGEEERAEEIRSWCRSNSDDPLGWASRIDDLEWVMDRWFTAHPRQERGVQQKITRDMTFGSGSWQAIDTEVQVPGEQDDGRRDIIAVRRDGESYTPVIIELKHGTKAFSGPSGLKEHYRKMTSMLRTVGRENLIEYIRNVWAAKQFLGIIEEDVPDAESFRDPELMFAVTGWDNARNMEWSDIFADIDPSKRLPTWIALSEGEELDLSKAERLCQEQRSGGTFGEEEKVLCGTRGQNNRHIHVVG